MAENGRSKQRKPDATGPELFAAWIDAGTPKYREFAVTLVEQGRYKSVTGAFSSIGYFASRDTWQKRKENALNAAAEAKLTEACVLDADSFLNFSRVINQRSKYATSEHADVIVKMRESVRKPQPKTAAVQVNLNLLVEELAQKYGLTADERAALFADVQADLATSKAGAS